MLRVIASCSLVGFRVSIGVIRWSRSTRCRKIKKDKQKKKKTLELLAAFAAAGVVIRG